MGSFWRSSQLFKTLRFRLALWFTIALSLIVAALAVYLYFQLRRSLLAQVDTTLQLVAAQAQNNLLEENGQITFQNSAFNSSETQRLIDDAEIRLVAPDGSIWDSIGVADEAPQASNLTAGFTTIGFGDDQWALFSQAIQVGNTHGWLEVIQELEPVQMTLQNLLKQMLWGVPLAILLAGLGGYFLANQALGPVDRITLTAQSITSTDLSRRIDHSGPEDEIGRLARTLDEMLERLQYSFERERRFTADAAHELRTPLAALKGRIGVTLSRTRAEAEYIQTLREMEGQVDRLIHLSSDLLYMARLDRRKIEEAEESIEISSLLGPVLEQVMPLARIKNINLQADIPEGLVIRGIIDLLIRLFLNLLDNAIKFTPPGGSVTVWAAPERPRVLIGVSYTGTGISPEHLPHLFERFYRAENDRARLWENSGEGGAGLGLAIAYEIAQLHGGQLTVQSEADKGTTFILHMPLTGLNIEGAGNS